MYKHSLYQVLISQKKVHIIKLPFLCFIKASYPLFNYDDEPSVPNGIMYQLPSFHLLIHRVLTKLSNRVMPYGENFCQLQLLFVFDCYRPSFSVWGLIFQWTLPPDFTAGLCVDAVYFTLHLVYGFLSRTLPSFSFFLELGRTLELCYCFVCSLCCLCYRLFRSYNVSQKLLRVICCPFCQDCKNHSQYLAGCNYQ